MAAPKVKLKRSSTAGSVPATSDLELGEIALNTYDGKAYFKKDDGTESIVEIGTGAGSGGSTSAPEALVLYNKNGGGSTASFDGVETRFQLRNTSGDIVAVTDALTLCISLDGVIQKPNAGTPASFDGFYITTNSVAGKDIVFSEAPASTTEFFGILSGVFSANSGSTAITYLDDLSSSFDGLTTDFTLTVSSSTYTPQYAVAVLIVLGGVVQIPTDSYSISGSTISFTQAPPAGTSFHGIDFKIGPATSGVLYLDDGSATEPSLQFTNDGNTGIYRSAPDEIAITTGGSDRLVIDSNGNTFVKGNLTVEGTSTSIETSILEVEDHQIEIGVVASPSDLTADNGGIVLHGTTNKTILWSDTTDAWTSSEYLGLPAGAEATPSLFFGADVNSGLYSPGADQIAISTNGTQRINITANGNVNIDSGGVFYDATSNNLALGTVSPGFSNGSGLEIERSGISTLRLQDASGSGAVLEIYAEDGNMSAVYDSRGDASNHGHQFRVNGTERARIDSTGRLLVKTSSSLALGNVNASIQVHATGTNNGASLSLARFNSDTFGPQLHLGKSRNATVGVGTVVQDDDELGLIHFSGDDGTDLATRAATIGAFVDGTPDALGNNIPGRLVFSTTSGTGSSPTTRMTIDSSGNVAIDTDTLYVDATNNRVGVNTTSPTSLLHIASTTAPTIKIEDSDNGFDPVELGATNGGRDFTFVTNQDYYFNNASSTYMTINSSGNVGIGETSPSRQLTVNGGASSSYIQICNTNSGTGSTDGFQLKLDSAGAVADIINRENGNMRFFTNNDQKMVIDSSGNVGIGATTPTAVSGSTVLEVQGTSGAEIVIGTTDTTATAGDLFGGIAFKSADSNGTPPHYSGIQARAWDTFGGATLNFYVGRDNYEDNDPRFVIEGPQDVAGEALRIDSSGRLGIGTPTPSAILDSTPISGNFNLTHNGFAGVGLFLRGNGTDGDGNYGPGIGFSSPAATSQKMAGIAAVQTTADANQVGLAFITHPSATGSDNLVEALRIDHAGRLLVGATDGTTEVAAKFQARAGGPNSQGTIMLSRGQATPAANLPLGDILFADSDEGQGARISSFSDAAWTSGTSFPSRLAFYTTTSGESTPTEKMRISAAGNVGIGTTGPEELLHLRDASGPVIRLENTDTTIVAGDSFGSLEFECNDTSNAAGIVGKIECFAHTTMDGSAPNGGALRFFTSDAGPSRALTEHMRINSLGDVGVGTTAPSQALHIFRAIDGDVGIRIQNNDGFADIEVDADELNFNADTHVFNNQADNSEFLRITSTGLLRSLPTYNDTTTLSANVFINSLGQFSRSTSSIKYKADVETLQDSYADAILDCRPVWYRSTSENDNSEWGYWGFIAEEVAEIDPRLVFWKTVETAHDEDGAVVSTPCDPEPEGVQYDRFVPHLLNLIKRQQQAIETLEAKVAALEGN